LVVAWLGEVMVFVEWGNAPLTITHLSPSKANELLNGCRLKLVLEASENSKKIPELIPNHPSTSIGTIIHKLREMASKPWLDDFLEWDAIIANDVFDQLLLQEQDSIMSNESFSHLFPLSSTKGFENKKMLAIFEVVQLRERILKYRSRDGISYQKKDPKRHILFGSEIKVWNLHVNCRLTDGNPPVGSYSIKGYVDFVKSEGDKVIISDYKSGSFDANVPKAYLVQLALYSEMWSLTAKHLNDDNFKKIFVEIETPKQVIPLEVPDSKKILSFAESEFKVLTDKLHLESDPNALIDSLAYPNEKSCSWCNRRPGCSKYLDSIEEQPSVFGFFDLVGILISPPIKNNVNSTFYQFRIRTNDDEIWLIDGVHAKWIENAEVKLEMKVGVFGGYEKVIENNHSFNRRFNCQVYSHALFFKY
jgi:hypothetical protein